MNEAASIFLRADIQTQDGQNMADWLRNDNITMYLNEMNNVSNEIITLLDSAPEGMLSYHFNRQGRFFMVCEGSGKSIGFIKLVSNKNKRCEVVYVIGEEKLWGRGYGRHALELALEKAFFEMRADDVIANIKKENVRSSRAALHCGMAKFMESENMQTYRITSRDFIAQKLKARRE